MKIYSFGAVHRLYLYFCRLTGQEAKRKFLEFDNFYSGSANIEIVANEKYFLVKINDSVILTRPTTSNCFGSDVF